MVNQDTEGKLQLKEQFLGHAITGLGGGYNKLYVIEEGQGFEGRVTALHKETEQEKESRESVQMNTQRQMHNTMSEFRDNMDSPRQAEVYRSIRTQDEPR